MASESRELERITASLRESETRFRDLFDRTPVGYYECDAEGRIVRINQTALTQLGYTDDEVLGQPEWAFVVERETARQAIADRLAGDEPTDTFERTWRRKDGSLMPAIIQYQALRDAQGKIAGLRATLQDITAYKQIEEQLRYAQKMQTVGQLAGGVAHEFNNLLQVVTGYSEVLLSRPDLDAPISRAVGEIKKSADRAVALTRQLLAFGQRQVFSSKILDLNAFVVRMNEMLRSTIGENIELVTVTRPGLWPVKADPGQIEQVILSLAVNARDAMPQGGRLTIETANTDIDEGYASRYVAARPGPYVMLSVSDTGCGMSEEVLSHLFEPFFTTKGLGRGIGLGLATVYGIVRQSGGGLDVTSELRRGAASRSIFLALTPHNLTLLVSLRSVKWKETPLFAPPP